MNIFIYIHICFFQDIVGMRRTRSRSTEGVTDREWWLIAGRERKKEVFEVLRRKGQALVSAVEENGEN